MGQPGKAKDDPCVCGCRGGRFTATKAVWWRKGWVEGGGGGEFQSRRKDEKWRKQETGEEENPNFHFTTLS